jgi:Uma2 family endonuclease
MGMPAQLTCWTAEMARRLPDDGNRYEVLDGELYLTPVPSLAHQSVVLAFLGEIRPYVDEHALGLSLPSPSDIEFSPTRLVQPDLFVVANTEAGTPRSWEEVESLLLAVEVASPSTEWTDRNVKRHLYQSEGVEFWVVDESTRSVERWRPGDEQPELTSAVLEWQPRPGIEPLRISLPELFSRRPG